MKVDMIGNSIKLEETVLLGLSISSEFMSSVRNLVSPEIFTNDHTKLVCKWIIEYYDSFHKAPGGNNLFRSFEATDGIGREDQMVIKKLFERMDNLSGDIGEDDLEWFIQKAKPFFYKRELELKMEKAAALVSQDSLTEAEKLLAEPSKTFIGVEPESPTSDKAVMEALFEEEDSVFQFPGKLGELMGPLSKPWFIIFQAPMKRGKTQFIQEMAFLAATEGKKVWFVSLEMSVKATTMRLARRITGCSNKGCGEYLIPVFDCKKNQYGTCENPKRIGKVSLYSEESDKELEDITLETVKRHSGYKTCSICRNSEDKDLFELAVWHKVVEKGDIRSISNVRKIAGFERYFGRNIKFRFYPKFSKSVIEVFNEYRSYSAKTGFVADIVIIDYLDITKPPRNHNQSRDTYDEVWKIAAGLASENNVLLVSPAQGSRASIKKAVMEEEDTTEDIRKLAHVDAMFSLNQTRSEKRKNIIRVGTLVHRHKEFDLSKNAMVLWQLGLGQVILDSEEVFVSESDFNSQTKDSGNGKKFQKGI